MSKLLLFSSNETTKFKTTRMSGGGFTFRMGREFLRTYSAKWLLGRASQKDKRREVRAPSYKSESTLKSPGLY